MERAGDAFAEAMVRVGEAENRDPTGGPEVRRTAEEFADAMRSAGRVQQALQASDLGWLQWLVVVMAGAGAVLLMWDATRSWFGM